MRSRKEIVQLLIPFLVITIIAIVTAYVIGKSGRKIVKETFVEYDTTTVTQIDTLKIRVIDTIETKIETKIEIIKPIEVVKYVTKVIHEVDTVCCYPGKSGYRFGRKNGHPRGCTPNG